MIVGLDQSSFVQGPDQPLFNVLKDFAMYLIVGAGNRDDLDIPLAETIALMVTDTLQQVRGFPDKSPQREVTDRWGDENVDARSI